VWPSIWLPFGASSKQLNNVPTNLPNGLLILLHKSKASSYQRAFDCFRKTKDCVSPCSLLMNAMLSTHAWHDIDYLSENRAQRRTLASRDSFVGKAMLDIGINMRFLTCFG